MQTVTENVHYKLMWYMNIQCNIVSATRRPDIVIANKMKKTAIIIDVVCGNTWEK